MDVSYENLMKKVQANRSSISKRSLHKWNYSEPYKMIITDIKDQENGRLAITVAFEVDDSLVEKVFTFANLKFIE